MKDEDDYYLLWALQNPYGATGDYWSNADDIRRAIIEKWKKKKKKQK